MTEHSSSVHTTASQEASTSGRISDSHRITAHRRGGHRRSLLPLGVRGGATRDPLSVTVRCAECWRFQEDTTTHTHGNHPHTHLPACSPSHFRWPLSRPGGCSIFLDVYEEGEGSTIFTLRGTNKITQWRRRLQP